MLAGELLLVSELLLDELLLGDELLLLDELLNDMMMPDGRASARDEADGMFRIAGEVCRFALSSQAKAAAEDQAVVACT